MKTRKFKPAFTMSTSVQLALLFYCYTIHLSESGCPRLCECKWKSGKESVICLNANFSSVPPEIDVGTQILDLTGNNLTSVKHEQFKKAGLVNLQKIFLANCRLKTLERYSFKYLINLVELDLSNNLLNNVPSHTFDSITELRELKLSGNPIQKIFNDAFVHLSQLIRLEISECRLTLIESRAFSGLEKSLESLKLDNNRLTEVLPESFTSLQNLHGLELDANPWNCSCFLRPLRAWMLKQNVPFGVPPVCHSPKRLYMKSWDKLDLDDYACVPEIFAYNSKAYGIEGKNITMTCRITGVPEPSVRWLMKNKVIANISGTSFAGSKKLYLVHLTNNSSELTIFSADLQDAGTYICAAENKAGRAEASVTLLVSKKQAGTGFSHKILIVVIVTGLVFVLGSCLISLCIYAVKKKQVIKWRTRRKNRREDNYEKIEMNFKVVQINGNVNVNVNQELAVVSDRRNGEYRVVSGADTDQEADEEEDTTLDGCSVNKRFPKLLLKDEQQNNQRWNSSKLLEDHDDVGTTRKAIQEYSSVNTTCSTTCGTYSQYSTPVSSPSVSSSIYCPTTTKRYLPPATSSVYLNKELSRLVEDREKDFPDLIEISPKSKSFEINQSNVLKAKGTSGSTSDINEIFCTLPRKKELHSARYRSNDSQTPLLHESRYGSSGGESIPCTQEICMADLPKYSMTTSLNRNRVNKMSNSYMNLTREGRSTKEATTDISATPLLDVSNLESHVWYNKPREIISPTMSMTPNANSYDYHAAQLERFLEEYRSLQKQLKKMKETCDNLCMEKEREKQMASTFASSTSIFNKPSTLALSPNSNQHLASSMDFRNFEDEIKKYLIAKNLSPNNVNNSN
ncbi:uncharacterized protein kek3 isoform X1 [Diabrotica undecimpunctata]|uniref:uncharacterized protein kek3 isoform X1 n=1 Tax=Diabrotica undecimpunctata TaxID=50387 RepID=UPI003B63D94C